MSFPIHTPTLIQCNTNIFDREKIHTLEFKSNSVEMRLQIDGPLPGSWFGVAFISWTDPKQDRIEQQGEYRLAGWLTVVCGCVCGNPSN